MRVCRTCVIVMCCSRAITHARASWNRRSLLHSGCSLSSSPHRRLCSRKNTMWSSVVWGRMLPRELPNCSWVAFLAGCLNPVRAPGANGGSPVEGSSRILHDEPSRRAVASGACAP